MGAAALPAAVPADAPLDRSFEDELRLLEKLPLEEFTELCAQGVLGFRERVPDVHSLRHDPEAAYRFITQVRAAVVPARRAGA
ncbi:hypothetical protein [Streptomyces sp. NPDC021212]|uniref:hypothetical protein n=1 Tax=Streptomyces sp. NPDC021212 TaxID=3365118 RepID=UPI00378DA38F